MVKKSSTRKARRSSPKKKASRKASKSFLGGLGSPKAILIGTAGLMVAQRYQPFGGMYKPAVDKMATGAALSMLHMGNHDLLTAGIKEAAATLANGFIGGQGVSVGGISQGDYL